MKTSRHYLPVVVVAAAIAGSSFLIQRNGFFEGAFRTEILASVKAEDVLNPADLATMGKTVTVQAIDKEQTASLR